MAGNEGDDAAKAAELAKKKAEDTSTTLKARLTDGDCRNQKQSTVPHKPQEMVASGQLPDGDNEREPEDCSDVVVGPNGVITPEIYQALERRHLPPELLHADRSEKQLFMQRILAKKFPSRQETMMKIQSEYRQRFRSYKFFSLKLEVDLWTHSILLVFDTMEKMTME